MTLPVRNDGPPKRIVRKIPEARTPSAQEYRERNRFYRRSAWTRRTRPAKLAQSPLCERCLAAGMTTVATQVHHIKDLADRPDLAHDLSNLESLCAHHHAAETRRRMNAK